MRMIDGDTLIGPMKLLEESYRRCGAIERAEAYANCLWEIEQAPTVSGWIPFVKRQLTDDEKKTHPDWCYILEGSVPEDEEEILLYRPWKNSKGYIITMDQYMNNGTECYLDGAGDIENGMFWMPLPEPPKEDA